MNKNQFMKMAWIILTIVILVEFLWMLKSIESMILYAPGSAGGNPYERDIMYGRAFYKTLLSVLPIVCYYFFRPVGSALRKVSNVYWYVCIVLWLAYSFLACFGVPNWLYSPE
jgi:hypothetical protein